MHGTMDSTVPIAQSELFYEKLQECGVDVTFVKVEGASHDISGPEVSARVESFLSKYLRHEKIEVSAEPIKIGTTDPAR